MIKKFQAWFETGDAGSYGDATLSSRTAASSSFSYLDQSSTDVVGHDNKVRTYLYIQMEYCPRLLPNFYYVSIIKIGLLLYTLEGELYRFATDYIMYLSSILMLLLYTIDIFFLRCV